MDWLRARMHLFSPIAMVLALIALGVDWALGTHTRQETMVYAGLALGGIGLLAMKLSLLRQSPDKRGRDD